jgi:hypothetical protein
MTMSKLRILAAAIVLTMLASSPSSAKITVEIDNQSGVLPQEVYLLVTGKGPQLAGITPDVSIKLSALTNRRFRVDTLSAGRVIFSYKKPVAANQQPVEPSARFDKVELTYAADPAVKPGAANLTAVDFLGIPLRLETLDAAGNVLQQLGYYSSMKSLAAALEKLAPRAKVTTDGRPDGPFARILSPALRPSAYASMRPYVASVAGQTVMIGGSYSGPVAPSPNGYAYRGTFATDGTISLTGSMTQPANPPAATLAIQGSTLPSAIYTDNGPYTVAGKTRHVADNDVYAAMYRDLVAGFDFGYVVGRLRLSVLGPQPAGPRLAEQGCCDLAHHHPA